MYACQQTGGVVVDSLEDWLWVTIRIPDIGAMRVGVDEASIKDIPGLRWICIPIDCPRLQPGDSETIGSGEPAEIQLVREHVFWLATWHSNSGVRFVRTQSYHQWCNCLRGDL